MLKLYYKVFVDMYFKLKQQNIGNWKFTLIVYLSAFLSIILISIVIVVKALFDIEFFSHDDGAFLVKIKAILIYFIPSVIFNYFLFIYNNRYEMLLKKYLPENGKYIIYFMYSVLAFFALSFVLTAF